MLSYNDELEVMLGKEFNHLIVNLAQYEELDGESILEDTFATYGPFDTVEAADAFGVAVVNHLMTEDPMNDGRKVAYQVAGLLDPTGAMTKH